MRVHAILRNLTQSLQEGETALHIASSRGNLDCVRCLLDSSKSGIDDPDKWGNTPLHLSVRRRYTQVAMLLLHAGAEFDLRNCVSTNYRNWTLVFVNCV